MPTMFSVPTLGALVTVRLVALALMSGRCAAESDVASESDMMSEKNVAAVVAGQPARTTQSPRLNCTAVLAALEAARGGIDNGTLPALVRIKDGNNKHVLLKIPVSEVSSIFDHHLVPPGAPRPALLYGYSSREHENVEKGLLNVTGPHLVKRWGVCASASRNLQRPSESVFVAELLPPRTKGGTEPISLEKYNWPAAETDPCRRFPVALGVVDSLRSLNEHGFVFDDWKGSQVRNLHCESAASPLGSITCFITSPRQRSCHCLHPVCHDTLPLTVDHHNPTRCVWSALSPFAVGNRR
jgi:hypothetical protein